MASDNENLTLLIQQLQNGSEHAFSLLYDKFSQPLYRNISRLVKDEDIAKELLQDLFLKIWESREHIDLGKSFKSFLYKVAENIVYGHFRRVAKDQRMIAQLITASVDFDDNAEEAIISAETHDLLKRAIESLSPQRKQIFTLCKLEGKSYDEVSNTLGISNSTIRDHMVKANKAIRAYFLQHQDMAVIMIATGFISRLH
jgi:RNA polymerase sigma-70 factor (family 1)